MDPAVGKPVQRIDGIHHRGVQAVGGGRPQRREPVAPLGVEPCGRRRAIGELRQRRRPVRLEVPPGGRGPRQPPVQRARPQRAHRVRFLGGHPVDGEVAYQVVQPVPVGRNGGQQTALDQGFQPLFGLLAGDLGDHGDRVRAEVRTGHQGQPTEGPSQVGPEPPVGQAERGVDAGGAGVDDPQAGLLAGEPSVQLRDGQPRLVRQSLPGDAQRQGHVTAVPGQLLQLGRVGGDGPGDGPRHRGGVLGRQRLQGQPLCGIEYRSPNAPAGEQHETRPGPGQQRPRLGLVGGVVPHHQGPALAEHRPVRRGPLVRARRESAVPAHRGRAAAGAAPRRVWWGRRPCPAGRRRTGRRGTPWPDPPRPAGRGWSCPPRPVR